MTDGTILSMAAPALAPAVRTWMFDRALPFWLEHGLDRTHGGAVESLNLDGSPLNEPFKRTRVICRQIYVFSHASLLGAPDAAATADRLCDHLLERVWKGDEAGWPRTTTRETAEALDSTPDLYDYAFVLFALAWRYKAASDPRALKLAHRTLDLVETRFRHPAGGFHHQLPPGLPRQQNPHMHLTEAALALAEASGDERFGALADELVGLFRSRFLRAGGVLPEFYDDDLRAVAGEAGRRVEPGHQFEWSWILAQHQKRTGADNESLIRDLVACAERHGVDQATQVTFNAVRDDGTPVDRGSRTWPNTERMKGWIALEELTGTPAGAAVTGSARLLLDRYLGGDAIPGAWIDAFDADGAPAASTIPASTLYHVFLAFAELLRRTTPAG
ncbi:MAG: AGE family epimerase/isomerase [Hyphomonadaceae bacterium]